MLLATSIFSAIYFTLILCISGHSGSVKKSLSADSYNTTNPSESWRSRTGRLKRSIYDTMPSILEMTIQFEEGSIITATLIKQQPILANKYLPVISSQMNPFINVMVNVGDFVMYHDADNCIAVVYFQKFGTFHGVIGLNYYITDLPYNFNTMANYLPELIGKPYVNQNQHEFFHINPNANYPPLSDIESWEDFLRPFDNSSTETQEPPTSEQRPSTRRQLSEQNTRNNRNKVQHTIQDISIIFDVLSDRQYYIETLVLVTRDFADLFKENFGEEEYVAAIVRYHIIVFNAVNLLLKKLKKLQSERFKVLINIAKIVIEGGSTSFGFEAEHGLQFTDVTTKLPQFFSSHRDSYSQESFDYVFVHTRRSVMDGNILVDAISKYGQNMVEGRKNGKFYETVPVTIAKFKKFYAHYTVVAHEIGRTLGMKITPKEKGLRSTGQCYSIMQREGPKCINCLAWSEENRIQFLTFFSKNPNRCFLLNEPRSLHPFIVTRGISPHKQCQCQGYESYIKLHKNRVMPDVRSYGCSVPLQCLIEEEHSTIQKYTILPFDGTPCGIYKVCWDGKCQKLGKILSNAN